MTSTGTTATKRSTRSSAASSARTSRARSTRPDITTLTVGSEIFGTVTGVRDFGAFVDVGKNKDGLLHASEADATGAVVADARDRLSTGDRVRLFVKYIDAEGGKLTLTAREPKAALPPQGRSRAVVQPSAAAIAAAAAAFDREKATPAKW